MDRQLENSRKVKDSQKKGFLWVGKRLESEILRAFYFQTGGGGGNRTRRQGLRYELEGLRY
jgi:hypothetical protein